MSKQAIDAHIHESGGEASSEIELTLANIWSASHAKYPDRIAVVMDHRSVTYAELGAGAERRAREMLAAGITTGSPIGILLPNCIEYIEILLGAAMIGAIIVPMNIRYKSAELDHLIRDSSVSLIYTCSAIPDVVDFEALLQKTLPELKQAADASNLQLKSAPELRTILTIDDGGSVFLPASNIEPFAGKLENRSEAEQTLFLLYTSGTTASAKGCIISNAGMLSILQAMVERFALNADDVYWTPLPLFHLGGIASMIQILSVGGTLAAMSYFNVETAMDVFERYKPTVIFSQFPTITLAILGHPRFDGIDTDRIRLMFNVAPPDLQRSIQARIPHAPLCAGYGSTETIAICYSGPEDDEETRFLTCGRPLRGQSVKIVDPDTREELPLGTHGEIAVRGPGLFKGYWNATELTRTQHLSDGSFLTGDIGSLDVKGRLVYHGRLKDQLKVGGENVSALEVESFLMTHPAVKFAQVVGVHDEKYWEVPAAFLELEANATVTEAEMIEFCAGNIARFKIPHHVRFVTEWPMSTSKVMKYRLRDQLEAELSNQAI